ARDAGVARREARERLVRDVDSRLRNRVLTALNRCRVRRAGLRDHGNGTEQKDRGQTGETAHAPPLAHVVGGRQGTPRYRRRVTCDPASWLNDALMPAPSRAAPIPGRGARATRPEPARSANRMVTILRASILSGPSGVGRPARKIFGRRCGRCPPTSK